MVVSEKKLGRSYSPIPVHLDADFGERAAAGSQNVAEAVLRIKDGAVRGTDEHFAGRIVVDRDALVCAGSLAGHEVSICRWMSRLAAPSAGLVKRSELFFARAVEPITVPVCGGAVGLG